jgi:hypothetical protein
MARIETRGGIMQFVGGRLDGLEVKLKKEFGRDPQRRNRSFAKLPDERRVLTSFLTEEREDEERYNKSMGIA